VIFHSTPIADLWVVELERLEDERGSFARSFCAREFAERGLETRYVQNSLSFNKRRGTLRGMHWQQDPASETKLVRVSRGATWSVVADVRPGSATRGQWYGIELSASGDRLLYVGRGLANGFITLHDDTEVSYQISAFYSPGHARGMRWNDPAFGISWPASPAVISDRDASFPDFGTG